MKLRPPVQFFVDSYQSATSALSLSVQPSLSKRQAVEVMNLLLRSSLVDCRAADQLACHRLAERARPAEVREQDRQLAVDSPVRVREKLGTTFGDGLEAGRGCVRVHGGELDVRR